MNWTTLKLLKRGLLSDIPPSHGVYRILTKNLSHAQNDSYEIVYIGCSFKGQLGLKLEIQNLLNPSRQHFYTLKPLLEKNIDLYYQYCETQSEDAPIIEFHLLAAYEDKHLGLPLRNRSKPKHTKCKYCTTNDELMSFLD